MRRQNLLPVALDIFRESRESEWFQARDWVVTRLAAEHGTEQGVSGLPEPARAGAPGRLRLRQRAERRWHTDSMEPPAPIGASGDDWVSEPIGPDDLTIMTPNGTVAEPESWSALVYSVLREPGGFLVVSSGPSDMYAQAINHEGRFLLEYRDGSPDQHFQVKDVAFASIVDALSQWMRGDRTFIDDHQWEQLSF